MPSEVMVLGYFGLNHSFARAGGIMVESHRPYTPDTWPYPRSAIVFPDELMAAQLKRRKFTVPEFYRMVPACILGEDTLEELIDGDVMVRAFKTRHHSNALSKLFQEILSVSPTLYPSVQCPIRLNDYNEPVADIALLANDSDREEHPGPKEVLLTIEVADTPDEVEYDRSIKRPLYARYGIPELWIIVLASDEIEVCREPTPEGYADVQTYRRGDALFIQELPNIELSVDDLLA